MKYDIHRPICSKIMFVSAYKKAPAEVRLLMSLAVRRNSFLVCVPVCTGEKERVCIYVCVCVCV
jgi:hypothetical protein